MFSPKGSLRGGSCHAHQRMTKDKPTSRFSCPLLLKCMKAHPPWPPSAEEGDHLRKRLVEDTLSLRQGTPPPAAAGTSPFRGGFCGTAHLRKFSYLTYPPTIPTAQASNKRTPRPTRIWSSGGSTREKLLAQKLPPSQNPCPSPIRSWGGRLSRYCPP